MKKNYILTFAVVFSFILIVTNVSAQQFELIPNGGFEEGMVSWWPNNFTTSASPTITADNPHSGDSCAVIDMSDVGDAYWSLELYGAGYKIPTESAIDADLFTFWAKADANDRILTIRFGWETVDGEYDWAGEYLATATLSAAWAKYEVPYVAVENYEVGQIWPRFFVGGDEANTGGTIWLDDVSWKLDWPVDVVELAGKKQLSVYPNPASEGSISFANLTFGSTVTLYDVTGKQVKSFVAIAENMKIDISEISQGIYFVKTQNSVSKLIVE